MKRNTAEGSLSAKAEFGQTIGSLTSEDNKVDPRGGRASGTQEKTRELDSVPNAF